MSFVCHHSFTAQISLNDMLEHTRKSTSLCNWENIHFTTLIVEWFNFFLNLSWSDIIWLACNFNFRILYNWFSSSDSFRLKVLLFHISVYRLFTIQFTMNNSMVNVWYESSLFICFPNYFIIEIWKTIGHQSSAL